MLAYVQVGLGVGLAYFKLDLGRWYLLAQILNHVLVMDLCLFEIVLQLLDGRLIVFFFKTMGDFSLLAIASDALLSASFTRS